MIRKLSYTWELMGAWGVLKQDKELRTARNGLAHCLVPRSPDPGGRAEEPDRRPEGVGLVAQEDLGRAASSATSASDSCSNRGRAAYRAIAKYGGRTPARALKWIPLAVASATVGVALPDRLLA